MIEELSDEAFRDLVRRAMTELSSDHMAALEHVVILVADEPSPEQAEKIKLRGDQLLLGLYEGIPRTLRSGYESGIMPDTITIFKKPLLMIAADATDLYEQVKRTVWHEIAHYFGISHAEMDARRSRH